MATSPQGRALIERRLILGIDCEAHGDTDNTTSANSVRNIALSMISSSRNATAIG
jgi:hypothetical protein